jgi:hypothetical protein
MTLHLTTEFGGLHLAFDPDKLVGILEWFLVYGKDENMDEKWRVVKLELIREAAEVSLAIKQLRAKEERSIRERQERFVHDSEPSMVAEPENEEP